MSSPTPTALTLHQASRVLEIGFDDGQSFRIPFELLRVYSPSAEVQGHGPGQEVLQTGKREVGITGVEPVGNYAIKLVFSDGHDSGLYSWDYLYELGLNRDALWQEYLAKLAAAGLDLAEFTWVPPPEPRKPSSSTVPVMRVPGPASRPVGWNCTISMSRSGSPARSAIAMPSHDLSPEGV